MGSWWEPFAALTCTSLFTASGVLQKPCDIFKISEIELQKGLPGLLPRPGTLSSSGLFFLVGLLRTHVYAASQARDATVGGVSSVETFVVDRGSDGRGHRIVEQDGHGVQHDRRRRWHRFTARRLRDRR